MPIEAELGFDTIVVPAREQAFEELYIKSACWYPIRVEASRKKAIKYIAVYRVAPLSAITHIAPVQVIERWNQSGKYKIILSGPAIQIGPVKMDRAGRVKPLQSARYTNSARLREATTLDELWP